MGSRGMQCTHRAGRSRSRSRRRVSLRSTPSFYRTAISRWRSPPATPIAPWRRLPVRCRPRRPGSDGPARDPGPPWHRARTPPTPRRDPCLPPSRIAGFPRTAMGGDDPRALTWNDDEINCIESSFIGPDRNELAQLGAPGSDMSAIASTRVVLAARQSTLGRGRERREAVASHPSTASQPGPASPIHRRRCG